MRIIKLLSLALIASTSLVRAQSDTTDLLGELNQDEPSGKKEVVNYTFKATRIVNSSTIEQLSPGVLDMRISHRFGTLDQGAKNFFGIDNAYTRIGCDYGINKNIMIGLGHNVLGKENDGFVKVKLLRQKVKGTPVSISYYASASVQTTDAPTLAAGQEYNYSHRLTYAHQLLVARKFSERLSLQFMPSLLHMNLVDSTKYDNDVISMGLGGRFKLTKRVALTGEYFYRLTGTDNKVGTLPTYNSLSIGFDIETGGHVFQLHFSNCAGISERLYLAQTTERWSKAEIRYGFNISRVFTIVKPKEFRK